METALPRIINILIVRSETPKKEAKRMEAEQFKKLDAERQERFKQHLREMGSLR